MRWGVGRGKGGAVFGSLDGMVSDDVRELPYGSLIRWVGIVSAVLMSVGALSGVVMLLLKWLQGSAPDVLSIIPLFAMPLAFVGMLVVMVLAVVRRRSV